MKRCYRSWWLTLVSQTLRCDRHYPQPIYQNSLIPGSNKVKRWFRGETTTNVRDTRTKNPASMNTATKIVMDHQWKSWDFKTWELDISSNNLDIKPNRIGVVWIGKQKFHKLPTVNGLAMIWLADQITISQSEQTHWPPVMIWKSASFIIPPYRQWR